MDKVHTELLMDTKHTLRAGHWYGNSLVSQCNFSKAKLEYTSCHAPIQEYFDILKTFWKLSLLDFQAILTSLQVSPQLLQILQVGMFQSSDIDFSSIYTLGVSDLIQSHAYISRTDHSLKFHNHLFNYLTTSLRFLIDIKTTCQNKCLIYPSSSSPAQPASPRIC